MSMSRRPAMRIGELARRTGVAPRLLRYYEEQGLITAQRAENGYREYSEADVAQVERVAGLVRAGMPTKLVRVVLDLAGIDSAELAATATRNPAAQRAAALGEIAGRSACLAKSRDTSPRFLPQTRHSSVLGAVD